MNVYWKLLVGYLSFFILLGYAIRVLVKRDYIGSSMSPTAYDIGYWVFIFIVLVALLLFCRAAERSLWPNNNPPSCVFKNSKGRK